MRQSLHGAKDILAGEAPADLAPEAAVAAWQALFFFVPIVSTTFASFDRVFSHLGPEALGRLFIDEAGQATPQNAAGAIWRSRRVVVVGDPLQLDPVLTTPFRAQQAIRNDHGVSEQWLPAATSVQKLADQLTPIGTTLHTEEAPIWVGRPLRAHRRCDEPMFSISNQVAYLGRMIAAPMRRSPLGLHPSAWIDVIGHTAHGHWIREEHEVLVRMLERLADQGQDMAQVFVITPFRDIARKLAGLPDRHGDRLRAGTIHTAQGKEADIVFLVLGGDPPNPARNSGRPTRT
jgi:superfamily I DNA and/or RNA helicase